MTEILNQDTKIEQLIELLLERETEVFLLDWVWVNHEKVKLSVDSIKPMDIDRIYQLSKKMKNLLEEHELDYSFEISSVDITKPLVDSRQYKKNIGKTLELIDNNGERYQGKLISVLDDEISIESKKRVPKKIGKGKMTEIYVSKFLINQLNKASVKIKY